MSGSVFTFSNYSGEHNLYKSVYYATSGFALLNAPWFDCQSTGITFQIDSSVLASAEDFQLVAYVPDRVTTPDLRVSSELETQVDTLPLEW